MEPDVRNLSVRFNRHFPGQPGSADTGMSPFWILSELRMMEMDVTTGAIKRAKLQSNRHHQLANTQFFYWPGVLTVAKPTVSEHRRKMYITFDGHDHPKLTWALPTLSSTTKGSWLPRQEGCQTSHQPLTPLPQGVRNLKI